MESTLCHRGGREAELGYEGFREGDEIVGMDCG